MSQETFDFLRPLVTGWLGKISAARLRAQDFRTTGEQCMAFFSGSVGFMWEDKFRKRFMGGSISPKFRMSLNKAFEVVALFGPVLYARNPIRCVRPRERTAYDASVVASALGVSPDQWDQLSGAFQQAQQMAQAGQTPPPELQQQAAMFQQLNLEIERMLRLDAMENASLKASCKLMEDYLSYTPYEQPNGGLEQAAEDAITEALIKGRGVLWPKPYTMPGSQTKLTGCFYDSCDHLLSDPDAESFAFGDTKWIAREHYDPWWEVERRFQLPEGSLKGKGSLESSASQADRTQIEHSNLRRKRGETFDLVHWWEIWSLGGVGNRLNGTSTALSKAFDETVGDYAYLCICEGVPYPLNATTEMVREATDEDVRHFFSWPVPYYLDQRWPCAPLEFYHEPRNPYPVAMLKPGLGELTFLNIVISALTNRLWRSSRTILAVLESARATVESKLSGGGDTVVIGLKDTYQDINKVISEFQHKDISFDLWRIIDKMFEIFDKRVGLSDLAYGLNPGGAVSRSATDTQIKEEKLSVRPDHMSKKVDQWMREVARMEKLCAYWSGVEGRDVRPLLGNLGATIWDRLITQADPEMVLREMDATVEPGTAKKRNREREAANLSQIYQPLSQQLIAYAQLTGDSTPLNELNQKFGDAIEQDMSGLEMGPWAPPPPQGPDPAELDAAAKQQEIQQNATAKDQQIRQDQQQHSQEMRQSQEKHRLEMRQRKEDHQQKLRLQKSQARMKRLSPQRKAS